MAKFTNKIHQKELIEAICQSTNLPKDKARNVVKVFKDIITEALTQGNSVNLLKFGRFCTKTQKARKQYNVLKGGYVYVPEKRVATFKMSPKLFSIKNVINKEEPKRYYSVSEDLFYARSADGDLPDMLPDNIKSRTFDEVLMEQDGVEKLIKTRYLLDELTDSPLGFNSAFAELKRNVKLHKVSFRCPECGGRLHIASRKVQNVEGQPYRCHFFKHNSGVNFCPLKLQSSEKYRWDNYLVMTTDEKYKETRALIARALRTTPGVNDIRESADYNKNLPYSRVRKPDILFDYQGKQVVIEIIINYTAMQAVTERDVFYRNNDTYPIWLFASEGNDSFGYLQSQMAQNIFYGNKRNVFFMDTEAEKATKERGIFRFKCNWLDSDDCWVCSSENTGNNGLILNLDELIFDEDSHSVYYKDADKEFIAVKVKSNSAQEKEKELEKKVLPNIEPDVHEKIKKMLTDHDVDFLANIENMSRSITETPYIEREDNIHIVYNDSKPSTPSSEKKDPKKKNAKPEKRHKKEKGPDPRAIEVMKKEYGVFTLVNNISQKASPKGTTERSERSIIRKDIFIDSLPAISINTEGLKAKNKMFYLDNGEKISVPWYGKVVKIEGRVYDFYQDKGNKFVIDYMNFDGKAPKRENIVVINNNNPHYDKISAYEVECIHDLYKVQNSKKVHAVINVAYTETRRKYKIRYIINKG